MPNKFGIVGIPKRGFGPLTKPPPGAVIDWQYPLAQGFRICVLGGNARYNHARSSFGGTLGSSGFPVVVDEFGVGNSVVDANTAIRDISVGSEIPAQAGTIIIGIKPTNIASGGVWGIAWKGIVLCHYGRVSSSIFQANWRTSANGNTYFDIGSAAVNGRYYSIATTHQPNLQRGYQNGVLSANSGTSDSGTPMTHCSMGGFSSNALQGVIGVHYFFYVYSRALNPTEIAQLHYSPYQMFWVPGRRVIFVPSGGASPQNLEVSTATGTGTAYAPTIIAAGAAPLTVSAATGTGAAYAPTITSTGAAPLAVGVATGTGTAYDPIIGAVGTIFEVGVATGTGAAHDPTILASGSAALSVSVATGTGSAHDATITATGAVTIEAGVATGTGTAHDVTFLTGQLFAVATATGSGTAYDVTLTGTGNVPFEVGTATGSGQAYDPAIFISGPQTFTVGCATGSGVAYDCTIAFPSAETTGGGGYKPRRGKGVRLYPDLSDRKPRRRTKREPKPDKKEEELAIPPRQARPDSPPRPPPKPKPIRLKKDPAKDQPVLADVGAPIAVAPAQAAPAIEAPAMMAQHGMQPAPMPVAEPEIKIIEEEEFLALWLLDL